MPSPAPFVVWVRGTDSYVIHDALSQVTTSPTDNFPTSIAVPSEANGWFPMPNYGLFDSDEDEGERYTSPSGAAYDDPHIREKFEFETCRYAWPSEKATFDALRAHFRRRYIYIATMVYPVALHAAGKALAVVKTYESSHNGRGGFFLKATLMKRGLHG